MVKKRIEKDTLGNVSVENDKYWGAQTQRSLENFKIGNDIMPIEIIHAMAIIKLSCAKVNLKQKSIAPNAFRLIHLLFRNFSLLWEHSVKST